MGSRGIILAAGRGSRLKSLSEESPKCLVRLKEKPLLEWQLSALKQNGVDPVALCTGYRSEALTKYSPFTFHNKRWSETNMVRTLTCASPWLRDFDCLISYSDIVYQPKIIEALLKSEEEISLTFDTRWRELWEARFENPLSDAETFRVNEKGRLTEIGQRAKNFSEIEGQYMGLLKISPRGWGQIEKTLSSLNDSHIDKLDMTSLLSLLISRGVRVKGVPVSGGWCEVDREEDIHLYESKIQSDPQWPFDWRK